MVDSDERRSFPDSMEWLLLPESFSKEQKSLRSTVRNWLEQNVLSEIARYWENAEFPIEIATRLRELPIMGGILSEYGCAGLDQLGLGLVVYELARCDGSITTFFSVHSGLAMGSIGFLGSEQQKARWLPPMARLEKIGAFGLTEPARGSDASHVQTLARRDGSTYILNGSKRWIGNASIADVLIIWARDEEHRFGGFVIENPSTAAGATIQVLGGKVAKRAVANSEIHLNDVRIPVENRLEGVRSFKDVARILVQGRYVVAWESAGAAAGAYEHALHYVRNDPSLAKSQLVQQKLAEMATEVNLMQLLCVRLAELMMKGKATDGMVALAKYNNAQKARRITQMAIEVMGEDGLLIENHAARLWTDAEVMYTYEGTNEISMLIAGREITGLSAFL